MPYSNRDASLIASFICHTPQMPCWNSRILSLTSLLLILSVNITYGQIGGKTIANGDFILETAEDLDTTAESLGRDWVSDVIGSQTVLSPIFYSGHGFTQAGGQTSIGVFQATVPSKQGNIAGGFGVPMPSQIGQSTLTYPGNITSFSYLNFLACYEGPSLPSLTFQVLLECYPGNTDSTFPTVYWNYTPAPGRTFAPVSIPLGSPSGILHNPQALSAQTLMSQTRFLYFGFYAYPGNGTLTAWLDDIQLSDVPWKFKTPVNNWMSYR